MSTVAVLALSTLLTDSAEASAPRRPNIVFLIADDLGYGDLGCFGQRVIRTPHLDRLAAEGMKLTRHYAGNPVCATSRCVLLTGRHPGHATIRDNQEWQPEGQWPINDEDVTLAERLRDAGYATGGFGKWGLGGPDTPGRPLNQGFDRFYGYNCQRIAHNYYPTFLRDDGRKVLLDNPAISTRKQRLAANLAPANPASYATYRGTKYAADLIAEQALQFVRDHAARPFFLFYPTTVPHLSLQVPRDSLAEYDDVITEDPPYVGGNAYLPHHRPRSAYAAMITRMDRDFGRLFDLLDELQLDDNTIIVFTSDNGPARQGLGGSDTAFFQSCGGFRGVKGSMYEGGVRVPTIVKWPGVTPAGSVSEVQSGFEDWLPTLAHAANIRDTPHTDGLDLRPSLRGEEQERDFLYREFSGYGGQQAVWSGPWKAVRQNLVKHRKKNPNPVIKTELYHLDRDRSETTDVATKFPQIVAKLEAIMDREHTPSEKFPLGIIDE